MTAKKTTSVRVKPVIPTSEGSVEIKIVPAKPEPKKAERKISDVVVGDFFTMDKKKYTLKSFDGPTCKVVEMFTDQNGTEYGIAIWDLPSDTKID